MAAQTIRIKLRAYDHNLIDVASEKIVEKRSASIGTYSTPYGERSSYHHQSSPQV